MDNNYSLLMIDFHVNWQAGLCLGVDYKYVNQTQGLREQRYLPNESIIKPYKAVYTLLTSRKLPKVDSEIITVARIVLKQRAA